MEYKLLIQHRNDIRLVAVHSPAVITIEIVNCTIEYVSLDDVRPQYRIYWWFRDFTNTYLASWISSSLLSFIKDGIAFYSINFLAIWFVATSLSYVAGSLLSLNSLLLKSLFVLSITTRLAYIKRPDFFRLYKSGWKYELSFA